MFAMAVPLCYKGCSIHTPTCSLSQDLGLIVTTLVCEGIKCCRAILWPPKLRMQPRRLAGSVIDMSVFITCTWHLVTIRKWSSTHTDTHPHSHSLTKSFCFFLAQLPPLFQHEFKISSGEWKFQILLNQKHKSQACHKQTKERVRRHKGSKSQYSLANFIWLSHSQRI